MNIFPKFQKNKKMKKLKTTTKPHKKLGYQDLKILKEHHQFLRDSEEELYPEFKKGISNDQYGQMLAKRYYKKLYKRFALVDLTHFKHGK